MGIAYRGLHGEEGHSGFEDVDIIARALQLGLQRGDTLLKGLDGF